MGIFPKYGWTSKKYLKPPPCNSLYNSLNHQTKWPSFRKCFVKSEALKFWKFLPLKKATKTIQKTLPFQPTTTTTFTPFFTTRCPGVSPRSPQWLHLNWKLKHPWLLRPRAARFSHGDWLGVARLKGGYYRGAAPNQQHLRKITCGKLLFSRKI